MTADPTIKLAGLRKYYERVRAVDGVDLEISSGEIVALLGRNGAGKSTTIDMLLGLTRPDEGSVSVFGKSPQKACASGQVGAMLQIGSLPNNITVRDLVSLMMRLYPKSLPFDEIVERAAITDILDKDTGDMSGGQRQRVRFALSIVSGPDFLVLDEPTAAMDVEARRSFWNSLREWASAGHTVLFATHYLEEADAFADRIVLIADGKIVADGSTMEIRGMSKGKSIRCTMDPRENLHELVSTLPGVTGAEIHGDSVLIASEDSDATLRALLHQFNDARDIEVTGAGIEDTFLALTESHSS